LQLTPTVLLIAILGFIVLWKVRPVWRAGAALAGVIAAALAVGAIAPMLFVPSPLVRYGQLVGWELGQDYGGLRFDPATAQTVTAIPMVVDHPGWANGDDWLGEPAIAYTPWSVTITMHARDADHDPSCVCWYLSGMNALVQLSEPLGGRQLFDGSKSPPHPRSVGDPSSSFSR
jgi:hypothetical protein